MSIFYRQIVKLLKLWSKCQFFMIKIRSIKNEPKLSMLRLILRNRMGKSKLKFCDFSEYTPQNVNFYLIRFFCRLDTILVCEKSKVESPKISKITKIILYKMSIFSLEIRNIPPKMSIFFTENAKYPPQNVNFSQNVNLNLTPFDYFRTF